MDRKPHPQFVFVSPSQWIDYALLDSGASAKLERFGPYSFVRPEPQAMWSPALPQEKWDAADAVFQGAESSENGRWQWKRSVEPCWVMHYKNIKFWARATPFRHLGVFPEQASQWDWINEIINKAQRPPQSIRILNLFGYTGLATLLAASAGVSVTHIDASKQVINWARENQSLSGLEDRSIRWIVDDALKFAQREVRRQAQYDGLIIDPPKFGRGPHGELWKVYESLPVLLKTCRSLLSQRPLFTVVTAYAIRTSALSLQYALEEMFAGYDGSTTSGEMVLAEQSAGRFLSTAIFSRWVSHQL